MSVYVCVFNGKKVYMCIRNMIHLYYLQINPGQLWSLREVRSIICSYLHQVFIADPSLAKLVHFQVILSFSLSLLCMCVRVCECVRQHTNVFIISLQVINTVELQLLICVRLYTCCLII